MSLKALNCRVHLMGVYLGQADSITVRHYNPLTGEIPKYGMTVYIMGLHIHPIAYGGLNELENGKFRIDIEKAIIERVSE